MGFKSTNHTIIRLPLRIFVSMAQTRYILYTPSIYLSIDPSIYPSIYLSIDLSIDRSIYTIIQDYIKCMHLFPNKKVSSSREFFQRPHSWRTCNEGTVRPSAHLHVHHLHHHTPSRFIHACHAPRGSWGSKVLWSERYKTAWWKHELYIYCIYIYVCIYIIVCIYIYACIYTYICTYNIIIYIYVRYVCVWLIYIGG